MIQHPLGLIVFLLLVEGLILFISSQQRFKPYFKILPNVFWIYFIPMLAASLGWIDAQSDIYKKITEILLPASLFLLLVTVDIQAIVKLGKPALIMFFAGSFGVMLGAVVAFYVLKGIIGVEFSLGFGALSGSWTGGSANMIAVKEALNVPDSIFLPMVIVDTIVPYFWMGILVAFAGSQPLYDRWNNSDRRILDQLVRKTTLRISSNMPELKFWNIILLVLIALAVSLFSQKLSSVLPVIPRMITSFTWTIIIVTLLGLGLSFSRVRKIEYLGANRLGYWILFFVLTTIGARATFNNIKSTLLLIVAGFLIVAIHSLVVVVVGRMIRAPLFLCAVASQANLGGVASTPVIAEIYQPGMASVGLLLAILGNLVGTYLGIVVGHACQWVGRL